METIRQYTNTPVDNDFTNITPRGSISGPFSQQQQQQQQSSSSSSSAPQQGLPSSANSPDKPDRLTVSSSSTTALANSQSFSSNSNNSNNNSSNNSTSNGGSSPTNSRRCFHLEFELGIDPIQEIEKRYAIQTNPKSIIQQQQQQQQQSTNTNIELSPLTLITDGNNNIIPLTQAAKTDAFPGWEPYWFIDYSKDFSIKPYPGFRDLLKSE